jgi:hypothetical protein
VRKNQYRRQSKTIETIYRPITSVVRSDLEFLIPAEIDTYIDQNIRLPVRDKLDAADGSNKFHHRDE